MWRHLLVFGVALTAGGDLHAPATRPPAPAPAPSTPRLHFHQDIASARKAAADSGKPLLVLNILGDCHKHS
ncbi:MAG: hypothetical protein L0Z62_30010 [Gemmataceae bacterium]|nr:hypothetical protein [Gemmataceae bacterium]